MPTLLITGANRGIGLEFARQYTADGWKVIACCRSPGEATQLQTLADATTLTIEQLDLEDPAQIDALGVKYRDTPIDVLLNNAGIIGPFPIADNVARQHFGNMDYELWERVLRVNTFAPVRMTEVFVDQVAASQQKKIAVISSTVASISESGVPALAYASSKSALNRVMTIIARQLEDREISVGLYCPGYVKTRMDAWGYGNVEIPDSVTALRALIADLKLSKSGSFTRYDGTPIDW